MELTNKKCIPCENGAEPMTREQISEYLPMVSGWVLDDQSHKISRAWMLEDFKEALAFVNQVGAIAESEGHHPDIAIHYNKVDIVLWTHSIGGLSENDFIVASKINLLGK